MDKSTHDEREYDIYLMNYTSKKTIRLTDSWKTEQGPVIVKTKKLRAIKKPGVVKFRVFSFAEILFFPGKNYFHCLIFFTTNRCHKHF